MSLLPQILALALVSSLAACSESEKPAPEPSTEPASRAPAPPSAPPTPSGDLGYGDEARLFASPALAMQTLLAEISKSAPPRVMGFGEYHKLVGSAPVRSALRRFADEIFDVLATSSEHLVLETWQVDPSCGSDGKEVRKQVEKAIERPPETESEMQVLLRKMQRAGTTPHVLHFACEEYQSLLSEKTLDTEKLLSLISAKLEQQTRAILEAAPTGKMVLIYGGATHNNLFPYAGLEHWSYAKALQAATQGAYVEVDLYVPELVQDDPLLSQEAWYPLLKEARPDQVILVRRDPASYILILRKDYADGA